MDAQTSNNGNPTTTPKVVEMNTTAVANAAVETNKVTAQAPATLPSAFALLASLTSTAEDEIRRQGDAKAIAEGAVAVAEQRVGVAGAKFNQAAALLETGCKQLSNAKEQEKKLFPENPVRSQLAEAIAAAEVEQNKLRQAANAAKQEYDTAKKALEAAKQRLDALDGASALPPQVKIPASPAKQEKAMTLDELIAEAERADKGWELADARREVVKMRWYSEERKKLQAAIDAAQKRIDAAIENGAMASSTGNAASAEAPAFKGVLADDFRARAKAKSARHAANKAARAVEYHQMAKGMGAGSKKH